MPLPPPKAVVSALSHSLTAVCSCVTHLKTSMAPAYLTGGNMGGGVFPPPVLSQCPGRTNARSAPSWHSASPPGHYTPQLGSSLDLPSTETPPCKSWSFRPRFFRRPPVPNPPSPRFATLFWVCQFSASDPLANSFPQSGQITCSRCFNYFTLLFLYFHLIFISTYFDCKMGHLLSEMISLRMTC